MKVYCGKCKWFQGIENLKNCNHPSCFKEIDTPIRRARLRKRRLLAGFRFHYYVGYMTKNAHNDCPDYEERK